ncbi:MAG: T9SS type A sorting domain-containing protein [Chryseolinea sp.]
MKRLYVLVCCLALVGSALAQAPSGFETEMGDFTKSVHIFPNPTTEYVNVRLEHVSVDGLKVTVHNLIGNEINIETEKISDHEIRIRVKEFDAGYYLMTLKDDHSNFKGIFKFLKR